MPPGALVRHLELQVVAWKNERHEEVNKYSLEMEDTHWPPAAQIFGL
jgi:hypothetical protein